jgi:hypothetical protein
MENIMEAELSVPVDTSVTEVETTPPKKIYKNPYWSNRDNRHLIVTIVQPNGKESLASIYDKEGTNPDMLAVLKQYTEEQIDENTRKALERRNDNIKKSAERRESQKARAKQEALFAAKLEAFEVDAMKRLIRKSKSILEAQAYATILMMKELEDGKEKETD